MYKITLQNKDFFPDDLSFGQLTNNLEHPVILIANIDNFNFEDKQMFNKLYKEEKKNAKSIKFEKSRKTYILAHFLNHYFLQLHHFNHREKTEYQLTDRGKPYFKNKKNICFNISHSNNIVALAYFNQDLGVDIEHIKNSKTQIELVSKRFFSFNENNQIFDDHELFYKFWTKKEAVIKAVGCGITDEITNIETSSKVNEVFLEDDYFKECNNKELFIWSWRVEKYYLSLCSLKSFNKVNLVEVFKKDINYATSS
jgi:4'-phosphopantetheinyl transferase